MQIASSELYYLNKFPFSTKNIGIEKSYSFTQHFFLRRDIKFVRTIIVLLKGIYTDSRDKNLHEINQVGILDIATKRFALINYISI